MSDLRAGLVAVGCFLRGVPLFFRAAPKTPLRVLCLLALDTVRVLRHARPLPWRRLRELAAFLDFQACTNATVDHKDLCEMEYRAIRRRLEAAGLGPWIEEYLDRLRELEGRRPAIGGDHRRFQDVRSYREEVVRLSFATVTAIALDAESLEDGIRATHDDGDVGALYRIAMQCQVIDDVLDYADDLSAGLPSFLTASASLPHAMTWTAGAARAYGASSHAAWPLRMALRAVTALTRLVVGGRRGARGAMMQGKTMGLILAAVAFSAVGQLFLKAGARQLSGLRGLEFLAAASRNAYVLSGLGLWVAWTLCWLYALRVAPLSRAYGLTSLNYVLIPLASVYILGEPARRLHAVGVVLIVIGIACTLSGD